MTDKVICEKCGSEMVALNESYSVGMECPNCGWGWVTTVVDPLFEDTTVYTIVLQKGNPSTKAVLKAISLVTGLNYLQIRDIIDEAPVSLVEGKAPAILKKCEQLERGSVKYQVVPECPFLERQIGT